MSASCSKDEPTPEQFLSRANEAFAAQKLVEAEKGYREVLRLRPDDPVAQRQLGILYFDQGQLQQAYPLLKKSAELEPDNVDVQLKLAYVYFTGRDYQKAREAGRQVLEKKPGDQEALLLMVDTSTRPEDMKETQTLVDKLKARADDQAAYHLARGAIDLRDRNDIQAEAEFKTALGLAPKSSTIYAALGNLYFGRRDFKSATQAFESAAMLSPLRSPLRLRYADLKLQTDATADAKKLAEDMVRDAPDYLPGRVFLMKIVCNEKRDDDCTTRVANILAQDPLNYDALYQTGLSALGKGDATQAIRIFEQLSNMNRQDARVRYQLALAYMLYAKTANATESQKAIEGAENRLNEATKLAPQFEQAILLLSELKIKKGNAAAAVDLLVPFIKERPQVALAYYMLGSAYQVQQQRDKALAVYRQMTQMFPKEPQPPYLGGMLLLAQQQPLQAREAFEKSLEISSDFLPATEQLVNLDLADKQYASAMDRVQRLIEKDPKQPQLWAIRGKIYFAQQDFAHAETDLLKAIELDPKQEPMYLLLAQVYVASNRQDKAIERLNAFLKDNNNDVPALMQLGLIQESLKHYNEAREAYEKLLTVAPNFVAALNNLAVLYSNQPGQLDKAYELANKAREINPNDPNVADTVAWILFKKGQYRNALPLLQDSVAKVPNQPVLQFHLGMVQYMLGQEEPARAALQKAADASGDFPEKSEARQRLALLSIDPRTADAAVRAELEKYLKEQPNDPAAVLRLAQLQERDGALDQAIKTYQKIIDSDPQFVSATRRLAIIASQRSPDDPKSLELATKAREAYPDDPEIIKTLGILNYRRNYYPQAAELLKQAAAKRNDDAELLFYLGQTYHQLKQLDDCKGALERAMSLNLSPNLTSDAKSALADCSDTRRLALLSSQNSPDDPKTWELATKARETYPDDPEVAKILGILNYRRGSYPQAAELLKEAATKRKDDPELLYYLGQAYRQLKQRDECKGTLARALTFNLSPSLTDEAKRALADCSETPPT
jgi:tetratricopeptide (TPR) repeat protein